MMKKQLLFCSLALASSMTAFANVGDPVTDLSQLSNEKVYVVSAADVTRGSWCYDASNPAHITSTPQTGATSGDVNDVNQQFAFIKPENSTYYYIYNVASGKFLSHSGDYANLVDNVECGASYVGFTNSTHTDKANYPWVVLLDNIGINLCSQNDTRGVVIWGAEKDGYSSGDGGNSVKIVEAGDFDPTEALAKIKDSKVAEANTYLSVPADGIGSAGGYNVDLWNALNDFCGGDKVADADDVVKSGFDEALQNLKNAPLVPFSNDKVYIIKHPYTNSVLCAKEGDNKIYRNSIDASTIVENSEKWQVFQDSEGNYYLYNQGTKSYAKFEAPNWVFTETPYGVTIGAAGAASVSKYGPCLSIADGQSNMFNAGGIGSDNMTTWGTLGANDGSCFYFVETEGTTDPMPMAKMQAEQIIEDYDAEHADYVGAYSTEGIEHLKDLLQKTDVTSEELNEAMSEAVVKVQDGKYYWIKNVMPFNDGQTKSIYANPDGTNIAWNSFAESAAELWQFEKKDNDNYWIKNVNANKYIQLNNGFKLGDNTGANMYLDTRDVPYNFGLKTTSGFDYTMSLSTADGLYKFVGADATNGGYISSYNMYYENGVMRPTQWNIVEATSVNLTIGSTGYATAYFPFAVTIPEGVKAYTVSAAADGVATLSLLTGGTIPANTGVILSGDAKTYPFAITTSEVSKVEGNLLDGVTMATNIPETSYILANKNGNLGFYKVDPSDTKLAANKAYLNNANGSFFSLKLDGAVTGIQSVENAAENAPAYDLQGRRLPQVPTKGLYIQNGKKIMK